MHNTAELSTSKHTARRRTAMQCTAYEDSSVTAATVGPYHALQRRSTHHTVRIGCTG